MGTLRIERFTSAELAAHIELGASVYSAPEVTNSAHFAWKHLDSPSGASICIGAYDKDGDLTGHAFVLPRTFWASSSAPCIGATVTDLVVRPKNRAAATLIEIAKAMKAPPKVDIVIHSSNETSDVIYAKLFKFPVVFSLAASGLPISAYGAIKMVAKSDRVAALADLLVSPWRWLLTGASYILSRWTGLGLAGEPSPAEMSEIFSEHRQLAGAHFERNSQFLKWRFADGPIFNADVKWVWKKNRCLGYLSFKQIDINGLKVFVILDVVLRDKLTKLDAIAVKLLATKVAIDTRVDAIFTMANKKNGALSWLFSFPFFGVPDKFLPHPTPFYVHKGSPGTEVPRMNEMFFTLADLDYF